MRHQTSSGGRTCIQKSCKTHDGGARPSETHFLSLYRGQKVFTGRRGKKTMALQSGDEKEAWPGDSGICTLGVFQPGANRQCRLFGMRTNPSLLCKGAARLCTGPLAQTRAPERSPNGEMSRAHAHKHDQAPNNPREAQRQPPRIHPSTTLCFQHLSQGFHELPKHEFLSPTRGCTF